ncbi:glycosyltransferase family 2 protein [Butyrivibrio sp. VCB2001]|uniref:glycosyltransferase family 2 protein n=1 Tax=Butyrivibrio sp. VCB2001 TaxID=1280667 RepID=UPI0004257372|nr:glycosyltransferase family 2 protein [Butyrivibrio sp. VCB2001]
MDSNILVSVVIPTLNAEKFIRECLEATINQTYSNIEIIIVDNGSEDKTVEICKEYAERDKRINLFHADKRGVSSARNCGIDNSKGELIVFFDADDIPEKDIIESYLIAAGEWYDRDISFIACGIFYDNRVNKNVVDKAYLLESYRGFIEGENYILNRNYAATLAWLKIFNFVTNKLYNAILIRANNIRFDQDVSIGEDLKFNLDYLNAIPGYIGMVNRPLYHYVRRSGDSLSITYHEGDIEDTKEIYRSFLDWEEKQEDVSDDNLLVIKSIFLTDWISRLSSMHDKYENTKEYREFRSVMNSEVGSREFQTLLKEVFKASKISWIRYVSLRTGNFSVFCFFRKIYQYAKG